MIQDQRLTDLLAKWERASKLGQTLNPEELCRDCPELLVPLQQSMTILQSMSWLEEPDEPGDADDSLSLPNMADISLAETLPPAAPQQLSGSAEQFQHTLIAAGLFTARELRAFLKSHSAGRRFETARDLATLLLHEGRL